MSDRLRARDRRYVWHPFDSGQDQPVTIVGAKDCWLTDDRGKRYLDLIGSWWVCLHGHGRQEIIDAIHHQAKTLDHVLFSGFTHRPGVDLADRLVALGEGAMDRVFYSDNGSTAVECALKIAWQYWHNKGEKKRRRFLAFQGGYHGDTIGAMSAGFSSGFYAPFADLRLPFLFAPSVYTAMGDNAVSHHEEKALVRLDAILKEHGDTLAAVIIEPLIQAAFGMRMSRPSFLREVTDRVRRTGALIIYDEVFTGFGRTGAMFAFLKAASAPDIVCLAKGMTGGVMPLAATLCREEIHATFAATFAGGPDDPSNNREKPQKTRNRTHFAHGHSYSANPLGCAAALAALALFDRDQSLSRIADIEAIHRQWLDRLAALPHIRRCRVMGSVAAFDVGDQGVYGGAFSRRLRHLFMQRGLVLRPLGNVVYLSPPYTITPTDLDLAWRTIMEVLSQIDDG